MSSGYKWELSEWGDGSIRLAYWNALSGEDVIIRLEPDGRALLHTGYDENDIEQFMPIDLNPFLREAASDPLKPIKKAKELNTDPSEANVSGDQFIMHDGACLPLRSINGQPVMIKRLRDHAIFVFCMGEWMQKE